MFDDKFKSMKAKQILQLPSKKKNLQALHNNINKTPLRLSLKLYSIEIIHND